MNDDNETDNSIQLSPKGEVNSGGYIPKHEVSRYINYPPLFADPEGNSSFSIYQIRWTKKCRFTNGHNFFFSNFHERTRHSSLRSQNSEYPRIFQVTGANQNAQKLLPTDLVNTVCTNDDYDDDIVDNDNEGVIINIILYIQIENVEQELLTSAWDYTETYHN